MSENNKQQKIFVPGTDVREFVFNDGGSVLRFSIKVDEFAKFVKEHKNEKGYINFNINRRREKSQFGSTHTVSLDTWTPQKKSETKPQSKPTTKKVVKPAPEPVDASEADDNF